ncbi:hypothetical protein SPHINGO391_10017 [Sphingomonas aurantiaca]|uniref:Uncharacterized protein n=1 Tax=Sphingomonas aurantiaca TaxID=185949 RepID=A0A5E7XRA1_9SPHN|nr:hypothetical protein SPHINGO391_10017 [Sphingomonas aurantiaca]
MCCWQSMDTPCLQKQRFPRHSTQRVLMHEPMPFETCWLMLEPKASQSRYCVMIWYQPSR